MSNTQTHHATPPDVLRAKPFAPKVGPATTPFAGLGLTGISNDDLKQKLASMKLKQIDQNQNTDKPNIQPKPLQKPSVVPKWQGRKTETGDMKETQNASSEENTKTSPVFTGRQKANSVKDSISMFESPGKDKQAPKVTPKTLPKSARFPQKKTDTSHVSQQQQNGGECNKEQQTEINNSIVPNSDNLIKEAPLRPARLKKSIERSEGNPTSFNALKQELALNLPKNSKPNDVKIPSYPKDLDDWIIQYVLTNSCLSPLANINRLDKIKTESASSHSSLDTQSCHSADEIYDDVSEKDQSHVNKASCDTSSEIYDDVGPLSINNEQDVKNPTYEVENLPNNHTYSVYEVQEDEENREEGDMLYEPVETIQTIVNCNSNINSTVTTVPDHADEIDSHRDKKKDDKEKKEKEKKDRKEKERLEKERKREEKEEKKRKAKERKMFGLKPDDELHVLEKHVAIKDYKGKDKDLMYAAYDCIEIVSKTSCPKGRWLAQTVDKKLGYVLLSEFGINNSQQSESSSSLPPRIPTEDEMDDQGDLYEAVDLSNLILPKLPPERVPTPQAIQEDIYDDIGN